MASRHSDGGAGAIIEKPDGPKRAKTGRLVSQPTAMAKLAGAATKKASPAAADGDHVKVSKAKSMASGMSATPDPSPLQVLPESARMPEPEILPPPAAAPPADLGRLDEMLARAGIASPAMQPPQQQVRKPNSARGAGMDPSSAARQQQQMLMQQQQMQIQQQQMQQQMMQQQGFAMVPHRGMQQVTPQSRPHPQHQGYARLDKPPPTRRTEEDEVFANTKPRVMTEMERRRQRRYFVAEDEWQLCDKFVFFPVAPLKQAWDFLIMICVTYACIVMPYRAVFEEARGYWFWFETGLQFTFLLDVLLSFNTAYLDGEVWVVHRPRIIKRYFSFWFWIDFPSSIPVEFIIWKARLDVEDGSASKLLPALRMLRLFRLLRLLKLLQLGKFIKMIEDATGYSLSALRVVNTIILLAIFCHISACGFYFTAKYTQDEYPKTWVTYFDGGYLLEPDTPVFDAYLVAFFWAIGLVCGPNTNITAESMGDRIFSIFAYTLFTLFFAYIIAVVTDQLQAYVADPRNKKMDEVQTFCRFHKVGNAPGGLERRLQSYCANYHNNRSMVDDEELIATLTPSLRDEVMDHLLRQTVRLCPLLHPVHVEEERIQKFQEVVYSSIRPISYEAKAVVLQKNVHSEDLYFLRSGQVNAVLSSKAGLSLERTLFPINQVGAFFGEQCLLGESSEVNFLAACRTDVLCVPKDTLIDAANEHLDEGVRELLAENVYQDILKKALRRIWGLRIQFADLVEKNNKKMGSEGAVSAFPSSMSRTAKYGSPLQGGGLRRRGNTVISTYHGNAEILAMLIQIWYLVSTLHRLKRKSGVEMMPELMLGPKEERAAKAAEEAKEMQDAQMRMMMNANRGTTVDSIWSSVKSESNETAASERTEAKVVTLSEKFDTFGRKMERLNEVQGAVYSLERHIAAMEDALAAFDGRFTGLEARFAGLETLIVRTASGVVRPARPPSPSIQASPGGQPQEQQGQDLPFYALVVGGCCCCCMLLLVVVLVVVGVVVVPIGN